MKKINHNGVNNMMKVFKTVILLLLLILAIENANAAKPGAQGSSAGEFVKVGAAGAQFLKIGVGARSNGMAGAYSSVANDLTALYWNPAGLANVKDLSGEFHYTQWFAGFSHSFAAMAMPLSENYTVAVQLVSFSSDQIPVTTVPQPLGNGSHYTVSDFAFGLSLSGYLTEQFSFGVNAKLVNNAFTTLNSSGIAFDIGTMYETGIQGIKLGFSVFNLGSEMQYEGQDLKSTKKYIEELKAAELDVTYLSYPYTMPLIFRAGLSTDIIDTEEHKLLVSGDFVTLSDTPEQFAFGAEYIWNGIVAVRGGYRLGQDQMGLSGGIGFSYITGGMKGQIDYSITPTTDLGLINRIGIAIGLN